MSAAPRRRAAAIGSSVRRYPVRWIASLAALAALTGVLVLATRPQATALEAFSPLVGKPAPPIKGTSLTGSPVDLSQMRGRFVVVNFFASWCLPCFDEQPQLVQFSHDNRTGATPSVANGQPTERASILGVAFDDPATSALNFLRSTGASWPAIGDPQGTIALRYGVRGPPETFVIAPDGLVIAHIDGPVAAQTLRAIIARAAADGA